MKDLFTRAQGGEISAAMELYKNYKNRVFYIAYLLTASKNDAEKATAYAFSDVWEMLVSLQIKTEREFEKTVINKAVFYCRSKIIKNSPKAFKTPENNNFLNVRYEKSAAADKENIWKTVINELPILHRFVYVLSSFAGFSKNKLSQLLKTNEETITIALAAEESNILSIINANFPDTDYNSDSFHNELNNSEASYHCGDHLDKIVNEKISQVCKPFMSSSKKRNLFIGVSAVVVAILAVILGIVLSTGGSRNNNIEIYQDTNNQKQIIDASGLSVTNYADIIVKDYGTITVALDGNIAPKTVENFVKLANEGFYDGLTFHRIIEDFMVQGGDPKGDGTGGSDKEIIGEFSSNGHNNNISHRRGAISMARSKDVNSASSQFFIVHKDSTYLDGSYAAFGFVTQGMDVVDAICEDARPTDNNGSIAANQQPEITSIKIRTK